jgi:hypothetical protein
MAGPACCRHGLIDALEDEFDDANVESLPVVLLEVWNSKVTRHLIVAVDP